MAFLDLTGLTRYTTKMKAWVSGLIKNNSTTTDSGYALDASQAPLLKVLKKSYGSISAMGTISDSDVTADMVVVGSQLGTPSAQKSNWTVTAKAGSFTLAGTISGSTTLTIFWARSRGTGNQTSVIPYGDNAYTEQQQNISSKAARYSMSWGTSLTWTVQQAISLVLINAAVFVLVWTPSTSDISILVTSEQGTYKKTGENGQVTFGATSSGTNYNIVRSDSTLTFTASANMSVKVFT